MNPSVISTALLGLLCLVYGLSTVYSALIINSEETSEESPEPSSKPKPKQQPNPFSFDGGDALEDAKKDEEDGLDRFNVNSEREGARGESRVQHHSFS
jgi:hypothetical protein